MLKNCKFKTLGYSQKQYLIIYLNDTFGVGFLETEKKEYFDQILDNYLNHVIDKIKDKNYGVFRFKVNRDYIRRMDIHQRRYFNAHTRKYDSLFTDDLNVYSEDDQVLIDNQRQIHVSDEDLDVLIESKKRNRICKDDQIMNKFLPLRVKSRRLG